AGDAEGIAPDELEQLVAAQDLPRVPHERREELELERRQRDVPAGVRDGALREVDRAESVAVALRRLRPGSRAAEEGLDARDQLLPSERLRDVVVRTGLQATNALELLV